MIIVHHLNNSRSQRVLWLLEELGLEYELKHYERNQETLLAPATLREVHPLGKSPVITDGALTLAESGAIIEYLVERYGGGRLVPPLGTPERLRYTYWLHYAEGSLMPFILLKLVFDRMEQAAARSGLDESRPKLMDFLERIHARPAYRRALERGGEYDLVSWTKDGS
jgi:glutathione S-transferase